MRIRPYRVVVMLAALSVLSCVSAQVLRLGTGQTYPPIDVKDVQVFMTEADVNAPFEKVALIKLKGDTDLTNESGMLNKAKKEAAKLGANGLILGETREPSTGAKVAGKIFGIPTDRRGEALAIHFAEKAVSDTTRPSNP